MNTMIKWTRIVLGGLIGLVLLAGVALYPGGKEKLTRSYPNIPVEALNIPNSPEAVARGEHIASVWGCAKCHDESLGGMLLTSDPFLGTIPASNLTSGKGGIAGSYTDVDWIRAIRHGVKPDGRVEIFMYDYYWTMSDLDLGDLIAYLKQIPPVDAEYSALHIGPVLAIAPAVGLFTPAAELIDHGAARPTDPAPGATIEYGRYLSVLCAECHGTNLASKMGNWKQDDFVRALHTGVLPNGKLIGSTMSSKAYRELSDIELAALWLYFMEGKPEAGAK